MNTTITAKFMPCRTCKAPPGGPCCDVAGRVHEGIFHPTREADAELASRLLTEARVKTSPICGKDPATAVAEWERRHGRPIVGGLATCELNAGHPGPCAWWPTCGLPLDGGGRCDRERGHGPRGAAATPCRSSLDTGPRMPPYPIV